jgi:outer membrane protein OmpA-like peptidoglycan-associated protein
VRFLPPSSVALRGRLADLRREVQMVFGASLLGVATAGCIPEPRSASAAPPKLASQVQDGAEPAPSGGADANQNTESASKPGDGAAEASSGSSSDTRSASAVVAIYGGSSVAIHDEINYARHSLVIDGEGERTLAALKEALDAFDCDILILGHAGRDEANSAEWLSKRRAELVRERLIALGVDGTRLGIEARGSSALRATSPATTNRDRRVSFVFHASGSSSQHSCDESDRRKP